MDRNLKFDVVIVGGGTAGVAAALEFKKSGLSVVVITHRTYLGEDVCDSMRLLLPEDCDVHDPLVARLYGETVGSGFGLSPMRLKLELDRVLRDSDIPVLFGAYVSELWTAASGKVVQLSIQTRSGERRIRCRSIVDTSIRGDLARLANLPLTKPKPTVEVERRVIGEGKDLGSSWRKVGDVRFDLEGAIVSRGLWLWRGEETLRDGTWKEWMSLEQKVRGQAYFPGQDQSADGIWCETGERLQPEKEPSIVGSDFESLPLDAFSGFGNSLWFTGAIVNVEERLRSLLQRHDVAIKWGRFVGSHAVANLSECDDCVEMDRVCRERLPSSVADCFMNGNDDSAREECRFSAVEEVDVLVVGGGTAGAPAGVGAAREGSTTLVAEFLSGLGGVGTLGMIGRYWYGNRVGFTAEVDEGANALTTKEVHKNGWDIEAKMHWYHRAIDEAKGSIWYKTTICGALTEGNRVVGAVLGTPQGLVAVRARCVVDATGSAMVASLAGAATIGIGETHLAVQGSGLPGRNPGDDYRNTDYDFIDDSSEEDVGTAHQTAREKFQNFFDAGQHVDSRERLRIVGDYEVTPMDIRLQRVFPDTVVKSISNFDTHGFTVHPLFMLVTPDHSPQTGYVPLRALLPKGIEGILVTGLGISAHRDAMPVIRMQADVQNQGFAAGMIASLSKDGCIRKLDVVEVQKRLADVGILDSSIVGAADSFPLSDEEIDRSLAESVTDIEKIDRVFTLAEDERMKRLLKAYQEAGAMSAKHHFAFVLGILGNSVGADDLMCEIRETPWDAGWNYTGMGQFGASMSSLDARIIALGRTGSQDAVQVLSLKAEALPSASYFSHYRALAEAFVTLGDRRAVYVLEQLLERSGARGSAIVGSEERLKTVTGDSCETSFRNAALIELHLGAAMYRLDKNHQEAGLILHRYRGDVRGLFSKFATHQLKAI